MDKQTPADCKRDMLSLEEEIRRELTTVIEELADRGELERGWGDREKEINRHKKPPPRWMGRDPQKVDNILE